MILVKGNVEMRSAVRMESRLACVALAFLIMASVAAADDAASVIASIDENREALGSFTCKYHLTTAVVSSVSDWATGPYFQEGPDGIASDKIAEPCLFVTWARHGEINMLESKFADEKMVSKIQGGGVATGSCMDARSELYDATRGIAVSPAVIGGWLWEGAMPHDGGQIFTPFDYIDATGSNGSLTLKNLMSGILPANVIFSERSVDGKRVGVVVASEKGENSSAAEIVYTISLDEACLPIDIEFRRNGGGPFMARYRVTERRKTKSGAWFPARCVKYYGPRSGNGPGKVWVTEIESFDENIPSADALQIQLPLFCRVLLSDEPKSQFVNDVARPIDLDEVGRLISIGKRIANGEPRAKFLTNPEALTGSRLGGLSQESGGMKVSAGFKPKAWLLILNMAFAICVAVTWYYQSQRRNSR